MPLLDTILNGLAAVGGIGAALAAYWSYKAAEKANATSKQALSFETLSEMQREYAGNDMFGALNALNADFRDKGNVETKYMEYLMRDGAPAYEPLRRRVSHFFQRMAVIRETQVVEDDVLFLGWSPGSFKIIGDVIIPMEKALAKRINEDPSDTIQRLEALQRAAEDSYARRKRAHRA